MCVAPLTPVYPMFDCVPPYVQLGRCILFCGGASSQMHLSRRSLSAAACQCQLHLSLPRLQLAQAPKLRQDCKGFVYSGRECIIPEVNRNLNIGEEGVNMNSQVFRRYLSRMAFNQEPVSSLQSAISMQLPSVFNTMQKIHQIIGLVLSLVLILAIVGLVLPDFCHKYYCIASHSSLTVLGMHKLDALFTTLA